jgi:hypothetical protein
VLKTASQTGETNEKVVKLIASLRQLKRKLEDSQAAAEKHLTRAQVVKFFANK